MPAVNFARGLRLLMFSSVPKTSTFTLYRQVRTLREPAATSFVEVDTFVEVEKRDILIYMLAVTEVATAFRTYCEVSMCWRHRGKAIRLR